LRAALGTLLFVFNFFIIFFGISTSEFTLKTPSHDQFTGPLNANPPAICIWLNQYEKSARINGFQAVP
jgi:hypothetical protein